MCIHHQARPPNIYTQFQGQLREFIHSISFIKMFQHCAGTTRVLCCCMMHAVYDVYRLRSQSVRVRWNTIVILMCFVYLFTCPIITGTASH